MYVIEGKSPALTSFTCALLTKHVLKFTVSKGLCDVPKCRDESQKPLRG